MVWEATFFLNQVHGHQIWHVEFLYDTDTAQNSRFLHLFLEGGGGGQQQCNNFPGEQLHWASKETYHFFRVTFTASKWFISGHILGKFILNKHI